MLLIALLLLILVAPAGGSGGEWRRAAERAAASVPGLLPDEPQRAAALALASERLSPSTQGELAMLSVAAAEGGAERFINAGRGRVTAAIRTEHLVVTASSDAKLKVWRPANGMLLGEVGTGRPFTSFADRLGTRLLAAADASGRLTIVDLTDPRRPRLQSIAAMVADGRSPLAMAFTQGGGDVITLSADGTIDRVDVAAGRRVSRSTLRRAKGTLPWAGGRRLSLTAARFETEGFPEGEERVVVVTRSGAVAAVDLTHWRGRLLLSAGLAPGEVTSVVEQRYGRPKLVLGTTGGLLTLERVGGRPSVRRGPPITGVALDLGGELRYASGGELNNEVSKYPGIASAPTDGRVLSLTEGTGGLVAVHPGGTISLPGPAGSGVGLEQTSSSSVATFGSGGQLLVEEGTDANHVSRLMALRPGHGRVKGATVPNPELRSFSPARRWWPNAIPGSGLYLGDAAMDEEFVVAAGQDPLGKAVLLVWDARSGRPLRRLSLSIGDVTSKAPSVIGDVTLLPRRHLIAAYSTVQQLVAIWSTDTWQLVSTVPVGPLTGLTASPDESTLLATAMPEDEAGEPDSSRSKLLFIDPGGGRIDRAARVPGVVGAAWSPDGAQIATIGEDGTLRLRSADGEREVRRPIHLEGRPLTIAWRPDGRLLAVAIAETGVVLVDPSSGAFTRAMPGNPAATVLHLSWSPDSRMLVAVDSTQSTSGEFFVPGPPEVWALNPARLELRMCQIVGGPVKAGDWRQMIDPRLAPRPLCRNHVASGGGGSGGAGTKQGGGGRLLGAPVVAYRSASQLFVVDSGGHTARVAYSAGADFQPPSFAWAGPTLGWASSSEAGILAAGAAEAQLWSCPCAGAAWHHGALYAVQAGGNALLRFRVGARRPRLIPIRGRLGDEPRLLGFLGTSAVVTALTAPPSTSRLFTISPSGAVGRLPGGAQGIILRQAATPTARAIAFASTFNGGPCYATFSVGVISPGPHGRPRVSFPKMPLDTKVQLVSSLQVEPDGTVGAAIALPRCRHGQPSAVPPLAVRYQLHGGRWQDSSQRGQDVQVGGGEVAILRSGSRGGRGEELLLRSRTGGLIPVASEVTEMAARP